MVDGGTKDCCSCVKLKKRIEELEDEIRNMKGSQNVSEKVVDDEKNLDIEHHSPMKPSLSLNKCALSNYVISRYSRQILLPEVGPSGQMKIASSSVLIIGVGGLGCPAALYLAAAGVGRIGLVDYDAVDESNLQRQVLHSEETQSMSKVESGMEKLKKLNSALTCETFNISLSSKNCMEIISNFDIVLDCSDNVPTRYLLNDACIKAMKPLVSGSALRWEGQLTVYNCNGGPCYRCLYPNPPPPETVTNCSDAGVIGAVTGVIGALQALEAIKIIIDDGASSFAGKLLLYDGFCGSFRTINLRKKVASCLCSNEDPTALQLYDYEQFCGSLANDKSRNLKVLQSKCRISCEDYCSDYLSNNKDKHLLLDCRPTCEYEICSLQGSINIPLSDIQNKRNIAPIKEKLESSEDIVVLCKVGNESQLAVVEILKLANELGLSYHGNVRDMVGGIFAWKKKIDPQVPFY